MEAFVRDARLALRMIRREPGIALLAVVTLALGIGATTAIFTVVDSVLLRPLPYREPDRLVVALHGETASGPVSPADFFDYRRNAHSFERLAAAQAWGATLGGGDRPERIAGIQVSADMFDLLGVPAAHGRTFVAGEDEPGRERVVVLSHGLWQRRFSSDPTVVGRAIDLDGEPYVVVGVMPPPFRFAPFWQTRAEMWVPLSLARRLDDRSGRSLRVFGRLAPATTVAQAQAEMAALTSQLAREYPDSNTGRTIAVRPLLDKVVSGVRSTLVALLAMVVFVLLIACANVASALLARASGRQREIAVRAALGASRLAVVRQLLTESFALSLAGFAAGLVLAQFGINWLLALLPPGSLPRQQEVRLDLSVFAFAAAATVVCGVATGLVPALQLLRTSITSAFQDGSKGATDGSARKHVRGLLVAGEVTLALVLLVGAALMGRTMLRLTAVDAGFRVDHLAVATVSLAGTPHARADARDPMFQRVRDRLASLPGVTSASAINHLPLAGDMWTLGYTVEGRPAAPPEERTGAVYRIVTPGYFATMGLRLEAGREFTAADSASAPLVAVVNQTMAERQWPSENPVGRRIILPGPSDVQSPITIVGVATNARQSDWTSAPEAEVYVPFAQRTVESSLHTMTFVVRTSIDPASVATAIPRELAALDRTVPVTDVGTMAAVVASELWRERLTATLTGVFAMVALVLAAIGVYAVVAYSVGRRTREFGVRVALGATARSVVALALVEALRPVAVGSAVGLALAASLSRITQTFLYDVSPLDPLALGGAVLVLLAVATAAAWLPARRASRLDPVTALRRD